MFSTVNGRLHEIWVFAGNCSSEWWASSSWNLVDSFMSSHLSSFYFFCFDFFLRYEQDTNGAFFISWDVSIELLYAHISQISNTTNYVFMFFCVWSQNALNICFSSLQTYNLYIYDFKVRYVDKYLTNMCEVSNLVKSF